MPPSSPFVALDHDGGIMATSQLTTQLRANIHTRYADFNVVTQVRRTQVGWQHVREETSAWHTKEQALVMIFRRAFEERAAICGIYFTPYAGGVQVVTQSEAIEWFSSWWNSAHIMAHKNYGGAYLWGNIAWEYPHV